jgi:hypothetical protein
VADQSDIGHRPPGALFSMDAADNAEVIPADAPRGPDSMWSTESRADDAADGDWPEGDAVRAPRGDEDPWQRMGSAAQPGGWAPPRVDGGFGVGAAPRNGAPPPPRATTPGDVAGTGVAGPGVFSAEPVDRDDDVVDEDEVLGEFADDDPWTTVEGDSAPLFSNGAYESGRPTGSDRGPEDPWQDWYEPRPRPHEQGGRPAPPPFVAPDASPVWQEAEVAADVRAPHAEPQRERAHASHASGDREARSDGIVPDQHGLDLAIGRLGRHDRERAVVPLAVCGALLLPGEQVVGAVIGQMLGRTAAVVATRGRVLIVNDRRWQPIVDIYPIDGRLVVRGRHDRQVAALSFADEDRLSMVDGITDVDLAIDLADVIRHPELTDSGSSEEF